MGPLLGILAQTASAATRVAVGATKVTAKTAVKVGKTTGKQAVKISKAAAKQTVKIGKNVGAKLKKSAIKLSKKGLIKAAKMADKLKRKFASKRKKDGQAVGSGDGNTEVANSKFELILTEVTKLDDTLKKAISDKEKDKIQEAQDARVEKKKSAFAKLVGDKDDKPVKKDKEGPGFIQKLIEMAIGPIFAFLPTIILKVKQVLGGFKEKYEAFKIGLSDGIEKIAKWWQQKIVTPIVDFFAETIPKYWKKMTNFVADTFQNIGWALANVVDGTMNGIDKFIVSTLKKLVDAMPEKVLGIEIKAKIEQFINPAIESFEGRIASREADITAREKAREERDKQREQERIEELEEEQRKEEAEKKKAEKEAKGNETPPDTSSAASKPKQERKKGTAAKIAGMSDIKAMIKKHEGVRYKAYKDSLGLWTIGVGHLIGDGSSQGPYKGRTLSESEVDELFEGDFAHHYAIAQKTPGWGKANQTGQAAMIDLAFNMGQWWSKWPKTRGLLEKGDFENAADELLDSKWAQQVGNRALTVSEMIRMAGKDGGIGGQVDQASMQAKVEITTSGGGETVMTNQGSTSIPQSTTVVNLQIDKSDIDPATAQSFYTDRLVSQSNA